MSKEVNVDFFKTWSPAMAWVLGLIATDGCIYIQENRYRHLLIFCMKDLDILEKIKVAMKSAHKIQTVKYKKWDRSFSIYRLVIERKEIIKDLLNLGITPRKSKTLIMPKIPEKYFSHFVRGCLDGDGSVVRRNETNRPSFRYRIVSGSRMFTNQLIREMRKRGFPSSYLVKDSGANQITISSKVGKWLYRNKDIWYGARKYNKTINFV